MAEESVSVEDCLRQWSSVDAKAEQSQAWVEDREASPRPEWPSPDTSHSVPSSADEQVACFLDHQNSKYAAIRLCALRLAMYSCGPATRSRGVLDALWYHLGYLASECTSKLGPTRR